jgi:integrase
MHTTNLESAKMFEAGHSIPVADWPEADRVSWEKACLPGLRLKAGGAASHLAPVSRDDYERRYGAFLGYLQRVGRIDPNVAAARLVTPSNVEAYLCDVKTRVSSVTVYNCISKLKRVAQFIAPELDLSWLNEIEKDTALVAQPRSKFERFVLTQRLVEAGLALLEEGQRSSEHAMSMARMIRDGLMIALLALCPIRLKNFASLTIGLNLRLDETGWWIALPKIATKQRRADERRIPEVLYPAIDVYLAQSRPVLLGKSPDFGALWISSRTGEAFTKKNLGTLISKITLEAVGIDVSPHLFRTAGASTSAILRPSLPHLGAALLGHVDPRVTEAYYRRVTSIEASQSYSTIIRHMTSRGQRAEKPNRSSAKD